MLETFRLIGVNPIKSWDKTALATVINMVFEQNPALFANILPKDEKVLVDTDKKDREISEEEYRDQTRCHPAGHPDQRNVHSLG